MAGEKPVDLAGGGGGDAPAQFLQFEIRVERIALQGGTMTLEWFRVAPRQGGELYHLLGALLIVSLWFMLIWLDMVYICFLEV